MEQTIRSYREFIDEIFALKLINAGKFYCHFCDTKFKDDAFLEFTYDNNGKVIGGTLTDRDNMLLIEVSFYYNRVHYSSPKITITSIDFYHEY